jgi:hypothetical protein
VCAAGDEAPSDLKLNFGPPILRIVPLQAALHPQGGVLVGHKALYRDFLVELVQAPRRGACSWRPANIRRLRTGPLAEVYPPDTRASYAAREFRIGFGRTSTDRNLAESTRLSSSCSLPG